jgi:rhomboid protease GluP
MGEDRLCGFKRLFWTSLVLTPLTGLFLVSRSRKLTTQEIQINEIKTSFGSTDRLNINMTEIVRIILAINLLMFVAELVLLTYGGEPYLQSIVLHSNISQTYQFVTYQFLHAGLPHLFNNMFGLVMFGPIVERYYGKLKFILSYIAFGVLGALTQIYFNQGGSIIGASASVFGLITLFAIIDRSVIKIGRVNLRVRLFAFFIILSEIIETLKFQNDKIGHFAHIGGAVFAVLFFIIHYYASKTERR